MRNIAIPLNITSKGLEYVEDQKKAIDQALNLLLSTSCFSVTADQRYGFIFNNMRFEIFDENDGVIYNSSESPNIFEGKDGLYDKKISGSSKNIDTFAAELRDTISRYEKRLENIVATMTYIREQRLINVSVKGNIVDTKAKYEYRTQINVWK